MTKKKKREARQKKAARKTSLINDLRWKLHNICKLSKDGYAVCPDRIRVVFEVEGFRFMNVGWDHTFQKCVYNVSTTLTEWENYGVAQIHNWLQDDFEPRDPKSALQLLAECADE